MPKSICIAAGHGGFDSGAVGNGLEEKNINLSVSLALEKLLTAAGIHVVMTRTTDVAAGGASTVTEDLTNQCKIANDANVDLFFTIHANAANDASASGAEAWIQPSDASAAQLAQKCVAALSPIVGVHGEPVKDGSKLWVIHNTKMEAVLIELGFITNENDAKKMSTEPEAFAQALANVLIPALGGQEPAVTVAPSDTHPEPTTQEAAPVDTSALEQEITDLKAQLAAEQAKNAALAKQCQALADDAYAFSQQLKNVGVTPAVLGN